LPPFRRDQCRTYCWVLMSWHSQLKTSDLLDPSSHHRTGIDSHHHTMNTSTTSLVSTASSSPSLKPYICVQPSPHTHAPHYKSRIHCASPPRPQSFLSPLRKLCHFKPPQSQPRLQDRERAIQKHAAALSQREEKVRLREEMLLERERSLKARFFELAQQKVRDACDAAARKDEPAATRGAHGRRWKQVWMRKSGGTGWAKWEEGRFG
jgi:hypothetical protein